MACWIWSKKAGKPVQRRSVSVIVPVFGNAETLVRLHAEVAKALADLDVLPEFIFVNDASPDTAAAVLKKLQSQNPGIRIISNPDNIGQQSSIRKGLGACRGESVIVMDADLQDPPSAIPRLLKLLWRGDYQAVFASRVGIYQSRLRMVFSVGYRMLIRRLTHLPKGAGGYVVLTRQLADQLAHSQNPRFYLAGLIGCHADNVGAIPVQRDFRNSGKSTYKAHMRLATAFSNILCVLSERYWFASS